MLVNEKILTQDEYILALSGGADSMALLHYLKNRTQIKFRAVHVNHNIQSGSWDWATLCIEYCNKIGVPVHVVDVFIEGSSNVESRARQERYRALNGFTCKNIITAHHADDQVETFFLKAFRGSGIRGLHGMKEVSTLDGLTLYRPLLEMTKSEILNYCLDNGVPYVYDPSNSSNDYDRNALRNQIIPFIEGRFATFKKALLRTMSNILDADECLTDLARIDYESVQDGDKISIKKIRALGLTPARIRNMLVWYMNSHGLALNQTELLFFSEKLLTVSYDSSLELVGRNGVIRKLKQHGKYLTLI